jgi:hypothetical protein
VRYGLQRNFEFHEQHQFSYSDLGKQSYYTTYKLLDYGGRTVISQILLGVFDVKATAKTRSHDKPDQWSSRRLQSLAAPWKFKFKIVF